MVKFVFIFVSVTFLYFFAVYTKNLYIISFIKATSNDEAIPM